MEEKEFTHFRLAKLRLPQIEQFVKDWYAVRIENERERDINVGDLIRILREEEHVAIRDLAENPLLLTIIALVHRIDAVLPDERVVLYQKCTETLLNTWHTWKFREDQKNRGKVERRNKRRMEAIANWMHCQSLGTARSQRAIVRGADLLTFLTQHIADAEEASDPDQDAQDMATDFLEFVRKRAGLLVEVGEGQYSFVHLTFQEYLTSASLITRNEMEGAPGIWKTIKEKCGDPRWNEVIRLLIASLQSNDSQRFLVEQILKQRINGSHFAKAELLGGLLLDAVEPAEEERGRILEEVMRSALVAEGTEQLRHLNRLLRMSRLKDEANTFVIESIFEAYRTERNVSPIALALQEMLIFPSEFKDKDDAGKRVLNDTTPQAHQLRAIFGSRRSKTAAESLAASYERLYAVQDAIAIIGPFENEVAVTCQALLTALPEADLCNRLFQQQLALLARGGVAPFIHFFGAWRDMAERTRLGAHFVRPPGYHRVSNTAFFDIVGKALRSVQPRRSVSVDTRALVSRTVRALGTRERSKTTRRRKSLVGNIGLNEAAVTTLGNVFDLEPRCHWLEAIRVILLPRLPGRLSDIFQKLTDCKVAGKKRRLSASATNLAAAQLIFDCWLHQSGYHRSLEDSPYAALAAATMGERAAALRLAHCIRGISYGIGSARRELFDLVNLSAGSFKKIFDKLPATELDLERLRSGT